MLIEIMWMSFPVDDGLRKGKKTDTFTYLTLVKDRTKSDETRTKD